MPEYRRKYNETGIDASIVSRAINGLMYFNSAVDADVIQFRMVQLLRD